ncbi:SCO4848 family membrane protein [Nocardioides sp. B-3]|uniref:SCO4848 family membrane protein n=1 Tax=Nocardioides sp. B-3 TaxID=2895565 RepID=UPI002152CA67|nr:hypothetical protein [Nocardioides sp. B-3]UUZ58007.1 hypothetical protein LP418_16965 [Nocardioides sp. B-3]
MQRKHGLFLLGVAVWNFITWGMFTKNLYAAHSAGEDRPAGYWIAHTVLIVINPVPGGVFAALGCEGAPLPASSPAVSEPHS